MPVSLRLRPISSQLTIRMPASPAPQPYQPEPAAYQPQSAPVPPPEPEPEVVQEEVKRPPLYYFEEVEEKRARERELLASWYQPIPEPESPIATKPLTPPTTASKPPVETTRSLCGSGWGASGYRRQRRRGGNNLVHCRIRCGYAIVQPGVQRPTGSGERGHRSKTTAAQSRACSYASGTGLLRHQATVAAGGGTARAAGGARSAL